MEYLGWAARPFPCLASGLAIPSHVGVGILAVKLWEKLAWIVVTGGWAYTAYLIVKGALSA